MYSISIEAAFEASHRLRFADGTVEPPHSHQWQVTVSVCSETLNPDGLVMDFHDLESRVKSAIQPFVGQQLEKLPFFSGRNASAEHVARFIFDAVAAHLPPSVRLASVEITEAAGCRARYQS